MRLNRTEAILSFAIVCLILLAACPKAPSRPMRPWGTIGALVNTTVSCSTRMETPKGTQIAYSFDWGDETTTKWSKSVADNVVYGESHTYTAAGTYLVSAQAKSGKPSAWSESLAVVVAAEGGVLWSFYFTHPQDPEDSVDFTSNTFGLSPDGVAYIGSMYALVGLVLSRGDKASYRREIEEDLVAFDPAPAFGSDGSIYIGGDNDSMFGLNANRTVKWMRDAGGTGITTAAIGSDGTVYFQTDDSTVAFNADGTRRWAVRPGGGGAAPVIGPDGTVYVAMDADTVRGLDPSSGQVKMVCRLSGQTLSTAPAIDAGRNRLYITSEEGTLSAIDLVTGDSLWTAALYGTPSSPVIGTDGTVYIGAGGTLEAVNPAGDRVWRHMPPFAGGTASTPAVSSAGCVCFLVSAGKKDYKAGVDTLYAVNLDGQRRWACGLGQGSPMSEFLSAPKIDERGLIYVGSGTRAWCVAGVGGPAASPWPVFHHDARNTGRAQ